jgi:putative tryptophan/tyrosine transport system substrate-binding protein
MQFDQLKRREFIALLGGAAAWPLAARAQPKLPTIESLGSSALSTEAPWLATFTQRLRELGWIEGRTIDFEYRWAEGHSQRAAEFPAELVRLKVNVIVTSGATFVIELSWLSLDL